jgi:hypothetical protein
MRASSDYPDAAGLPKATALTEILERLAATEKTLDDIHSRLADVAERALGGQPGEGKSTAPHPVRGGGIGSALDGLDRIGRQLSSLQQVTDLLSTVA